MSRKEKFSSNWNKQQKKVRRIHSKILNCRNDGIHKLSTQLSKSHARLYREDLKIKNMTKSSKGDIDPTFEEELAKDVLEIITVFSARLYGSRSNKNKKIIENLKGVVDVISP